MKKAFLIFLLNTTPFWAQPTYPVKPFPRLYVVTPTVAYNNEKESKAVGIFLRGAMVDKYQNSDYAYKITLKTGETVYVTRTYNLNESLNARDNYEPSPAVIIENDGYYGSPHLFTTVAGLKIRQSPSTDAPFVGTILNGTAIPIDYYPYNPDAWIAVNIQNKKGFIPVKYLGQRPDLNDLIKAYKKANSAEDQKKYAERVLELGWNSSQTETAQALIIYADFASRNNQPEVAEVSMLQANVLNSVPKDNFDLLTKLIKEKQFGFTLNNELEPEKGFKKSFLETNLGKIKNQHTNLDDCGLDDYETNVFFGSAECIGHDVNKTYHIRSMEMVNTNGFKIKNSFLNSTTTLNEFLKVGSGLISSIDSVNEAYYINNDFMTYEFQFKKGLLYKVSIYYYC